MWGRSRDPWTPASLVSKGLSLSPPGGWGAQEVETLPQASLVPTAYMDHRAWAS